MANGANKPRFTPTEQKIVNCLKSGSPCYKQRIVNCLWDDQAEPDAIHWHLNQLRTKLKPGYEIICQIVNRQYHYRIIRIVEGEDPFH